MLGGKIFETTYSEVNVEMRQADSYLEFLNANQFQVVLVRIMKKEERRSLPVIRASLFFEWRVTGGVNLSMLTKGEWLNKA